uniref:RRM domain-containing protein n=1 Tax=Meloidogyne incognita TaxID=6306 RepID=A0A914LNY7_MELIC
MSGRRGNLIEGKVYVGGLPEDATSEELDDAFHIKKLKKKRKINNCGILKVFIKINK